LASKLLEHAKGEAFYGSGMQKQINVSHRLVNFPNVCVCLSGRKDTQNTAQYLQQDKQRYTEDAFVQLLLQWKSISYYMFCVCVCVCVFEPARAEP